MLKDFLSWWGGRGEDVPVTVRELTIRSVYENLNEYVDWACEQGLYLPPDYAKDPTGWAQAMRTMQHAFRLLAQEYDGEGELWEAKNGWKEFGEKDTEKIEELEKQIQEGLTLFGKYLFFMTDVIVDRGSHH